MADLLLEPLPTEWRGRAIRADYRPMVWLCNQLLRGRGDKDPTGLTTEALRRFYCEPVRLEDAPDAFEGLVEFYAAGLNLSSSSQSGAEHPSAGELAFDYQTDASAIVAAFQQAYGIDLTTEKLHWWRFRALFAALPKETQIAQIMSYRVMDLSKIEDPKQRQYYAELKATYTLPAELRGGKQIESVQDHDAAFLARFRRKA